MFFKKGVPKNLLQSLFNKVTGLQTGIPKKGDSVLSKSFFVFFNWHYGFLHLQRWDSEMHSQSETIFRNWKPFKNDEKYILFHLKSSFCSQDTEFLVMQKNDLFQEMRLISNFMTSQPGKQTIAIHIMPNISRGKGNQTMKFGKIFFWKNHRQDMLENIFPDLFLKNQNLAYLCMNSLKFYTVCFNCMTGWRLSKYMETKLWTTCFYLL